MNALIQSIGSFLNLPKLTAITVPGMVIAFALVLVLGPIPCRDTSKGCPYCPDSLKPVSAGAEKGEQPKGLTAGKKPALRAPAPAQQPTGPTAHFTMTAQDQTVSDSGTLHLNLAPSESVSVSFASATTQGSPPIKTYVWKRDNQQICNGPTCTSDFSISPPSNTITLTVTDSGGKTSTAQASVVVGPLLVSPAKPSNTVITSDATWLNMGSDSTEPEARAALLSKFEGLLPPLLLKSEPLSRLLKTLPNSCGKMPLYVVPSSRPPSDKSDNTSKDGGKNKAGTPQYTGETTRSVEDVLSVADDCYASLTQIDQALQSITTAMQTDISQDTTDLTALSTALVTAQTSANQLAESDLSGKIAQKKAHLQANQRDLKSLSQADSYVTTLIGQVTAIRKAVSDQATPAAAAKETAENIVTDVFETIQQNFLKFLLFSLIVGAIFDPIQRGLLSFFGPRRNVFEVFNEVYGQQGDGEIRHGDRRLPPWTHKGTFLPRFDLLDKAEAELPEKEKLEKLSLRYSPADFAYGKNMNIYDQNYAIGAGFITQSEFDGIYNEFFTQCQITTGLILPVLILSVCIGIRLVCCGAIAGLGPGWGKLISALFETMLFGFLTGIGLTIVISCVGSGAYRNYLWGRLTDLVRVLRDSVRRPKRPNGEPPEGTGKGATEERPEGTENAFAAWLTLGLVLCLYLLFRFLLWLVRSNYDVLGPEKWPFVMLPCAFLFPLWFAGLDRLHKYYSELQARIAGNILQQKESTEQKITELLSDKKSLKDTIEQLKRKCELADKLKKLDCDEKQKPSS